MSNLSATLKERSAASITIIDSIRTPYRIARPSHFNFSGSNHAAQQRDIYGRADSVTRQVFTECTFENCELVFDRDRPPTFKDNRFINPVFVFTEHATRTLYLLSDIYHAGEGGQKVIEKTFSDIREHKLHGHEIKTAIPDTLDHSFS